MLCWGCSAWWLWVCVVERVKEAASSEGPHGRDQHIHIGILCKGLVASLCNHTSEVWYCAWSAHMRGWVQSSSELLRELWWKCTTSVECKTDISAVLTVKSGLDPHMINKLKDGFKSLSGYFLWPCWVTTISVLTLAYYFSEGESCGEVFWRCCWVLGVRNPNRLTVKFGAFVSRISCKLW